MYINGLFLLLFWCLGWAQFGFINSLYLIIFLLVGLLFGDTRRQAVVALFIFLLASVLQYHLISIQYPLPWVRKDLRMEACVTGLSRSQAGLSLMLSDAQIDIPSLQMHKSAKPTYLARPQVLDGNVKVTIYPSTKAAQPQLNGFDQALGLGYLMGRKVELIVRLKGPKNLQNPEHFDYVRWRQLRGQVASGYVKQWLATGGACNSWNWPKLHLDKLRQSLWQRIQDFAEIHAMSSVSVALWGALMLGQTSALSAQQWRVLAASGTTHLLVISGLHVGLVAGLVMLLMRLLTFPFGIKSSLGLRVGAWVGLGAIGEKPHGLTFIRLIRSRGRCPDALGLRGPKASLAPENCRWWSIGRACFRRGTKAQPKSDKGSGQIDLERCDAVGHQTICYGRQCGNGFRCGRQRRSRGGRAGRWLVSGCLRYPRRSPSCCQNDGLQRICERYV